MEQNEGFIDIIVNSLKYGVSDLKSLFIGGLVAILSCILIGLPFLYGYITRCGRELLKGNNKMPEWENAGELFSDGLKILVIAIAYALVSLILYCGASAVIAIGFIFNIPAFIISGYILFAIAFLIAIVLGLTFNLSWIIYAVTGSFKKAINPINGIKLAITNPLWFIAVLVITWIVGIIIIFPSLLIITIPWMIFIYYISCTYAYTRFYQKTIQTGTVTQA